MLKELNDEILLQNTKALVKEEKKITQTVLDHLQEIESRRLYLLRSYPSLFEFCVKELKYSESSAHRRISAMRLIKSLPEAKVKLEEGVVNLSTLTQLQSFIKKEEKLSNSKLDIRAKRDLLFTIENKSQTQCDREFARINPVSVENKESTRPLTATLTEIKFVASEKLLAKLSKLKNLLGNKNKNSYAELFEKLADVALKKLEVKKPGSKPKPDSKVEVKRLKPKPELEPKLELEPKPELKRPEPTSDGPKRLDPKRSELNSSEFATEDTIIPTKPTLLSEKISSTSAAEVKSHVRYIPVSIRREVWHRDQGRCRYKDPITNRTCESQFALQIDHIIPFSTGGRTEFSNLRLLCRNHNASEALRVLGSQVMNRYKRK